MNYPVKWFDNSEVGAPEMSGLPGTLIAVLDACLINGFNLRSIDTLTCADGVATATISAGHGYRDGEILLIEGAGQSEYNGEAKIRNVTATTFDFDASGSPATPATGTITCKVAPIGGWEKAYESTTRAAYRSIDPTATGLFLRVDDDASQYALVRGYEAMSSVDVGEGEFPTAAQSAAGLYWKRSNSSAAAPVRWVVVGDSRMFYVMVEFAGESLGFAGYAFGDITSYKPGDAFGCYLSGMSSNTTYPSSSNFQVLTASGWGYRYLARSFDQFTRSVNAPNIGSGISSMLGKGGGAYPAPADNSLHLHAPVLVIEGTNTSGPLRGEMPGLLQPIQDQPLHHLALVDNIAGMAARTVLLVGIGTSASAGQIGRAAFDITGPWR